MRSRWPRPSSQAWWRVSGGTTGTKRRATRSASRGRGKDGKKTRVDDAPSDEEESQEARAAREKKEREKKEREKQERKEKREKAEKAAREKEEKEAEIKQATKAGELVMAEVRKMELEAEKDTRTLQRQVLALHVKVSSRNPGRSGPSQLIRSLHFLSCCCSLSPLCRRRVSKISPL
jgi:hypothetical protein